ncbi:hypothetical protein [Brachybacterium phenoliresistens]|uniref:Integral membrane protein n=1 Tax=Brachybacterium phenoliresistens TaxID=396014 RepID=Z9JVX3_9MICO|nr:hypothetical protein [Brachybacterium phenoliresistens]EWS81932.1 hypothetical protein BF93_13970 [Brachybacterium phenoliresistens]
MSALIGILVVLHLLCWAVALGTWVAAARTKEPNPGMFHAAAGALAFGVVLMAIGMATGGGGHLWYTLKLVFALIVAISAFVARRQGPQTPAAVWFAIPAGIVINVIIAVFHIGA